MAYETICLLRLNALRRQSTGVELETAGSPAFRLQKKLEEAFPKERIDQDIETVLSRPEQEEMNLSKCQ